MRDRDLDDLFAEARREAPMPSADLMARILADAAAERPAPAPARSAPRRRLSPWLLALFGGGGVFAGLATATLAGVWIGMAQPAPVAEALWGGTAGDPLESVDLLPGYDLFASLETPVEG
ncbi:dihydroorotate dehydrogenase [Cereibacter sphaeroides]|uniref:dihydroorotate dehydrogenase n=1 Tax=Cereibacter sphaeroides TaxID=1063 RepID=UPI003FCE8EB1